MNAKRKSAQEYILKYVDKIAPGGQNKELYSDLFKAMTDKEFDLFMGRLRDKKITLSVIVPHDGSVKVTVENNFKVAKEIGYEFFQRLNITDPNTGDTYLTPNRYLVYRMPVRRAAQLLTKKISVPKGNKKLDLLTGQVANGSKASKITMPEIQMLSGMGLNDTLRELLKYRGGDIAASNAMTNALYKNGRVDADLLEQYSSGVVATQTLKNYLLGAHIRSEGLAK